MKRLVSVLIGAGVFMALVVNPASAEIEAPGEPSASNCKGRTTAFLAQGNQVRFPGLPDYRGMGNFAALAELHVTDIHSEVDGFCAGED